MTVCFSWIVELCLVLNNPFESFNVLLNVVDVGAGVADGGFAAACSGRGSLLRL